MNTERGQVGFSLVEVLFAMSILTLGLIFVACQFPVGLATARDTAEITTGVIDTHNTGIMLELRLGELDSTQFAKLIITSNPNVHVLPRVNILADGAGNFGSVELRVDDPENQLALGDPQQYNNPAWPFLKPFIGTDGSDDLQFGNIGLVVCPAVDQTDKDVLAHGELPDVTAGNYEEQLNKVIYDVAMDNRNYCWSALYRYEGNGSFCFYIFTFRKNRDDVRYAMQDPTQCHDPLALNADEDRLFPVPWRVEMDNGPIDPCSFPANWPLDQFILNDYSNEADAVADVLREGSILIDEKTGDIYEVEEVVDREVDWVVHLSRDMKASAKVNVFWVFPPAVVRDGGSYSFASRQPVVHMVQQVIRF